MSDAQTVSGSYNIALPDGRRQVVNYKADPLSEGGYVADVQYKGQALYPQQHTVKVQSGN